jgi:hypothetical protein
MIAVYLTYFEIKKAKVSKEWGPQAPIIFYNAWQIILPIIDLLEYAHLSDSEGFHMIMRAL